MDLVDFSIGGDKPDDMIINPSTGEIKWDNPNPLGSYNIKVNVRSNDEYWV